MGRGIFMIDTFLASKLHSPAPRPTQVARPGLLARLEVGLAGRLTLVSAPAGFGKTTLVASWAPGGGAQCPVAWLTLDEADNTPRRFLTYLVAALDQLQPGLQAYAQSALQTPQLPPLEIVLAGLVNMLAGSDRLGVLILDDYHVIEVAAIHAALAFLVEHLPPNLHLVILSRSDPLGLPLARLRARAQLTEIRAQDLRFQADEAAEFLNAVMALKLSGEEVAALVQRTEGWAVGLQLAGLALHGRADPSAFIRAFAGSHVYVADYLVGEVLVHQTEPVRAFLLQTSILERLSAPLCEALMTAAGDQPAALMLEQLEHANLFLFALDSEREWYRYHHLFAELLQAHLKRTWPEQLPELHARAAAWFEVQGSLREAVQHWLGAGQAVRAAELLEQFGHARWMEADVAFMELVDRLPPAAVEMRPGLGLHRAWNHVMRGRHAQVGPQLQSLAQRLNMTSVEPAQAGMLEFVRMMQAYVEVMRGKVSDDTLAILQTHLAGIPPERLAMRNTAAFIAGYAHFMAGNFATAEALWNEAIERDRMAGAGEAIPICASRLGLMRIAQGRLHAAARLCRDSLQLIGPQNQGMFYVAGNLQVVLGQVLLEWNDLAGAGEQILAGLRLNELWRIPHAIALSYTALARLRLAEGDPAAAQLWLDKEAGLVQGIQIHPDLVSDFEAAQVRVWLAQADTAALARWRREHNDLGVRDTAFRDETRQLCLARLLLADRQPDTALALLNALADAARPAGRQGRLLEMLILQALAHQMQGRTPTALRWLHAALVQAETEGYQRAFLDEGEAMRTLLAQVQPRTEFVRQLLAAFPRGKAAVPDVTPERLTEREQEVLRLMAEGLNNQEIATRLVVGIGTVKTHVHNVLGKLQASHRAQAIARARELALL
jgi:LuxR family transcriptional regulator, maltose regulon positive regulatory protein